VDAEEHLDAVGHSAQVEIFPALFQKKHQSKALHSLPKKKKEAQKNSGTMYNKKSAPEGTGFFKFVTL
jgi:hypothetical protein